MSSWFSCTNIIVSGVIKFGSPLFGFDLGDGGLLGLGHCEGVLFHLLGLLLLLGLFLLGLVPAFFSRRLLLITLLLLSLFILFLLLILLLLLLRLLLFLFLLLILLLLTLLLLLLLLFPLLIPHLFLLLFPLLLLLPTRHRRYPLLSLLTHTLHILLCTFLDMNRVLC